MGHFFNTITAQTTEERMMAVDEALKTGGEEAGGGGKYISQQIRGSPQPCLALILLPFFTVHSFPGNLFN
jgi:hypothetical protein